MAKQSASDRLERLKVGRCPVHGLSMYPETYVNNDGEFDYTETMTCDRRNCLITVRVNSKGTLELTEKFQDLLDDNRDDPVIIDPNVVLPYRRKNLRGFKKRVWTKSYGFCYYCGKKIKFEEMTIDHIIPLIDDGETILENLAPCCMKCNIKKGVLNLVDFKFKLTMDLFEKLNGIRFNREQINFLEDKKFDLGIPEFSYWFEKNKI